MKGQIKTYSRTIFNTLEMNSRLLDILILLVAVDIHLNLCPSSFWIARHIDAILSSKKLIAMILFFRRTCLSQGVIENIKQ